MVEKSTSYTQILRSTSIIGGASLINILVGLVRTKVLAVLLGPAGIGLIGLLSSLTSTASSIAGFGLNNVGTRQISEAMAEGNQAAIDTARRALFVGTAVLSVLGALVFWVAREDLARLVLHDPNQASTVGWLAIGVALSVASGSQTALLNGMRKISDLAKISIYSSIFSTLIGIAAILAFGETGIVIYVLAGMLTSFLFGHWYVAKLSMPSTEKIPFSALAKQWKILASLGFVFMLSGLTASISHLFVRAQVQDQLGLNSVGEFQAAWAISMIYISFILNAMGTDYYPRLTAVIKDNMAVNRLVNEQTEVVLILSSPIFLAMVGFAPLVIQLLYSAEFTAAADVLRWQIIGDVFKIISWPLGYILLAAGAGKTFLASESFASASYAIGVFLLLPLFGLLATGTAFAIMYALYLLVVYILARSRTGFKWERRVLLHIIALLASMIILLVANEFSSYLTAIISAVLAITFGIFGLAMLGKMSELPGHVGKLAAISARITNSLGIKHG